MGKKPPLTMVPTPPATGTQPPRILGDAGRSLWDRVQVQYRVEDVGGLEMLAQACAAADRAEALAALIDRDGETIHTKGGLKAHPCLKDELAARAFVCRTLQRLGLDVEPIRSSVGRPGRGIGWRP